MTELEILIAARELISDPAHWTQGVNARNKTGDMTSFYAPDAFCFCTYGAIKKTAMSQYFVDEVLFRLNIAAIKITNNRYSSAIEYNDSHTHSEVLALFDAAIAELS